MPVVHLLMDRLDLSEMVDSRLFVLTANPATGFGYGKRGTLRHPEQTRIQMVPIFYLELFIEPMEKY